MCVVDDDESVRESLPDLLNEMGFRAQPFSSALEFLADEPAAAADCLILDVAMPDMTGPELQSELIRQGRCTPIIFITAHSEGILGAGVIATGAVACLLKPFTPEALQTALRAAIDKNSIGP